MAAFSSEEIEEILMTQIDFDKHNLIWNSKNGVSLAEALCLMIEQEFDKHSLNTDIFYRPEMFDYGNYTFRLIGIHNYSACAIMTKNGVECSVTNDSTLYPLIPDLALPIQEEPSNLEKAEILDIIDSYFKKAMDCKVTD